MRLDRESSGVFSLHRESSDVFHLKLAAFDGGKPALYDVVNVTVTVLDSNDNEPVFERARYQLRLPEDIAVNTRILTVRATDADLAANDRLIYGLARQTRRQLGHVTRQLGHVFTVDNKTGVMYVRAPLDRETTPEYQLIVTAADAPPGTPEAHTVDVTVHVIVDDVNDNAPQIVFNTLSAADANIAHVAENSVSGSFVAHVTASDADAGHNAAVSCQLTEHADNAMFQLVPQPFQHAHTEPDYQLMTSRRSADREARWRFNVTVTCSDDGRPDALTSYKSLDVYITDMNDNRPTFTSAVRVYTQTDDVSVHCVTSLITPRRSSSFAEYRKRFMARLNGVDAFGYNSAGSEPIWIKFGAL